MVDGVIDFLNSDFEIYFQANLIPSIFICQQKIIILQQLSSCDYLDVMGQKQAQSMKKHEPNPENNLSPPGSKSNPHIHHLHPKNKNSGFHPQLEICFYPSENLKQNNQHPEQCSICLTEFQHRNPEDQMKEDIDDDIFQLKCGHKFHKCCLHELIKKREWVKCPVCTSIFGVMMGDQPPGKIKKIYKKDLRCQGYNVGTHQIIYEMYSGKRDNKDFPGTTRHAYIPDTQEGREVLSLLEECFNRKLTFTIGRSVTTGLDHQIVWNGVHHKTSTSGGPSCFGYPDPGYFTRVKEELAAKGITKN